MSAEIVAQPTPVVAWSKGTAMPRAEWEATRAARVALIERMGHLAFSKLTAAQADEAVRRAAGGAT